jgi:bifunctional non-homologous end joining protein LigD
MAKLAAYRAKRDFQKTPEPEEGGETGGFAFVIQKHAATRLHYDLRLELDGVMLSWAVAKGPSLVPGEKRLSVHVEDHPIAYNAFEGTIPKGQYGGGTVMIWDRGRWEPDGDPHQGYAKGHLNFTLHGEKLGGAWHLVRMKKRPNEKQEPWLLIKSEDDFARVADAPDILDEKPLSIATGRDLDAIAADGAGAVWNSNRGMAAEARAAEANPEAAPSKASKAAKSKAVGSKVAGSKAGESKAAAALADAALRSGEDPNAAPEPAPKRKRAAKAKAGDAPENAKAPAGTPMPKAIEPCLATLVTAVPAGDQWLHEIKWDGYRLIVFKQGDKVRVATRRGLDWTHRFPGIAAAVAALPVERAILDGEAVIEDENGVSNFSALQAALGDKHAGVAAGAVFFAFDLLYLNGEDLRPLPLADRKGRLEALVPAGGTGALRLSEHLQADGAAMVRSACSLGLEGVISKRRDRPYRSGRHEDWLKIKCTERQEFVVVGYVPSTASKKAVGSLVLAYNEAGSLRYAGRAGTGFTADAARETWTRLDAAKLAKTPLTEKLTADERRGVVWVEPSLVAEIEFRGWTGDNRLRHAAFKGLREDKRAEDVVREVPQDLGEVDASPAKAAPASDTRARKTAKPAPAPAKPGARPDIVAGIKLTHPDRVLWADAGVTKEGLASFYDGIAGWLLPHLVHRPLSLVRCPAGAEGHCFFQKHSWAGLSGSIRRETVRDESGEEEVLYVDDIAGVVALVQAGVLEIHPWGARIDDVDQPDRITMDLDPGEDVAWPTVIAAARELRERLAADGLESFVKTTGGKGLHVVLPIDAGSSDWASVKAYAKALADSLERDAPDRFIAKSTKAARRGRIYVDYLRNGRGATAVAAYSTRARPGAPVSVPLTWDELSPAVKPNHYTVLNLAARLNRLNDPWAEIGRVRQSLPKPAGRKRR